MAKNFISGVKFLLSCWAWYLFLTLDPATPFYLKKAETWYLLFPVIIIIAMSTILCILYFVKLKAPYKQGVVQIVIQFSFILTLSYSLNYDLGNSLTQLRVYNVILFCFLCYYAFELVRSFF